MFFVRTIYPEDRRMETAEFDLAPALEQGQTVCKLFADFLAVRPPEFRERLSAVGAEPRSSTQQELGAFVREQQVKMRKAVKDSGARPD